MTPKQFEQHKHCQMEIRWKEWKNQTDCVPGLYCQKHNKWIQWLTLEMAEQLIQEGIANQPKQVHYESTY